ncbi:MAG: hypothetical protein K9K78_03080 [Spirochaetales bacterium]|nr:hypothetical protein [Spirochaetales bacterium]
MDKKNQNRIEAFSRNPVFNALPEEDKEYIARKAEEYRMSREYIREMIEAAADLRMWDDGKIADYADDSAAENRKGKQRTEALFKELRRRITALRRTPPDYTDFSPDRIQPKKHLYTDQSHTDHPILGTCPVAGEKTRCCSLTTLDAVRQCGFACSYCSIQSFYDANRIYFYSDLKNRLDSLQLDPDKLYHIGTGQSSDSLMFGNYHHLMEDLCRFTEKHPNVIMELKSKSSNIQYFKNNPAPRNMIFTWSLNPPKIIRNEEHLTASLEERLNSARTMADKGSLVGFHFHPIIRCSGWREDYAELFQELQRRFTPDETVMISLGTLTFIKPVLKQLRSSGLKSKVLRIPLDDAAGKYSYPFETKKEMFSFAYDAFSKEWKEKVFFYMCMEDPELWEPVFGYSYSSNDAFEEAMKTAYMAKIKKNPAGNSPGEEAHDIP